jgi:hypothetical protein
LARSPSLARTSDGPDASSARAWSAVSANVAAALAPDESWVTDSATVRSRSVGPGRGAKRRTSSLVRSPSPSMRSSQSRAGCWTARGVSPGTSPWTGSRDAGIAAPSGAGSSAASWARGTPPRCPDSFW